MTEINERNDQSRAAAIDKADADKADSRAGKYLVTHGVLHNGVHQFKTGDVVDLSDADARAALEAGVVVPDGFRANDMRRPDGTPLSLAEFSTKMRAELDAKLPMMHGEYVKDCTENRDASRFHDDRGFPRGGAPGDRRPFPGDDTRPPGVRTETLSSTDPPRQSSASTPGLSTPAGEAVLDPTDTKKSQRR